MTTHPISSFSEFASEGFIFENFILFQEGILDLIILTEVTAVLILITGRLDGRWGS
jgi:hypothetical protein